LLFPGKYYLDQLVSSEGNGMLKVVTGIRRCGKSFLLFNIFRNHVLENGIKEDHIIQEDLEDRRNKKLRDPDALLGHIDGLMTDNGERKRCKLEIDFVVNRHDERLYIQSAYAMPDKAKVDQEQDSLLHVSDGFRKIIIAADRYTAGYNDDGILIVSLYDFLLGKADIRK